MAGVKISSLPVAGAITGAELVAVVQGGTTKQSTVAATQTTVSGGTTGLTPATATAGAVTLAGRLAIANGGTNATAAPTAGAVPYGTGTAYAFTAAGTVGQVLQSNGASAPTWATVPGTGTVSSVAATVPAFLSVAGSPITTAGTLALSYSGTALPVANGGTNATTASITSFNNITGFAPIGTTGTTSSRLVFSASPTFTGTLAAAAITASSTINVTGNAILSKALIGGPTTSGFTQGLQLYGNTSNGPQNSLQWSYGASPNPATIYLIRSNATTATGNTTVANGDLLGTYGFGGTDGTDVAGLPNVVATAGIAGIVDSAVSANTVPTSLIFSTGTTVAVSRMEISSAGVVKMSNYGVGTATFSAAGVISSVSDETLKIKDGVIADPMPMIMALEPGYYFGKPEANMGPGRQLGFYAQNVRSAIGPEAAPDPESKTLEDGTVTTKPWGYYDRSVLAVAIEAIKVQKAQIDALVARILALEAK